MSDVKAIGRVLVAQTRDWTDGLRAVLVALREDVVNKEKEDA